MKYTIKTGTWKVPLARPTGSYSPSRLFMRMTHERPNALIKNNDQWFEVAVPYNELLETCQKFYLGGYIYDLTDEELADLPAGYAQAVTS